MIVSSFFIPFSRALSLLNHHHHAFSSSSSENRLGRLRQSMARPPPTFATIKGKTLFSFEFFYKTRGFLQLQGIVPAPRMVTNRHINCHHSITPERKWKDEAGNDDDYQDENHRGQKKRRSDIIKHDGGNDARELSLIDLTMEVVSTPSVVIDLSGDETVNFPHVDLHPRGLSSLSKQKLMTTAFVRHDDRMNMKVECHDEGDDDGALSVGGGSEKSTIEASVVATADPRFFERAEELADGGLEPSCTDAIVLASVDQLRLETEKREAGGLENSGVEATKLATAEQRLYSETKIVSVGNETTELTTAEERLETQEHSDNGQETSNVQASAVATAYQCLDCEEFAANGMEKRGAEAPVLQTEKVVVDELEKCGVKAPVLAPNEQRLDTQELSVGWLEKSGIEATVLAAMSQRWLETEKNAAVGLKTGENGAVEATVLATAEQRLFSGTEELTIGNEANVLTTAELLLETEEHSVDGLEKSGTDASGVVTVDQMLDTEERTAGGLEKSGVEGAVVTTPEQALETETRIFGALEKRGVEATVAATAEPTSYWATEKLAMGMLGAGRCVTSMAAAQEPWHVEGRKHNSSSKSDAKNDSVVTQAMDAVSQLSIFRALEPLQSESVIACLHAPEMAHAFLSLESCAAREGWLLSKLFSIRTNVTEFKEDLHSTTLV
jgi:hypothetical protein